MQPELPTAAEPRFGPNAREKLCQHIERVVLREDPSGVEATRSWKDELQAVAGAGGNIEQSAPAPSAPLPGRIAATDIAAATEGAGFD